MVSKINMQIYLIENLINNKKYVGMTTKSINCRFREHKTKSTQNLKIDSQMIHKAMQKYGVDNFSIKSLEICENHNDLIKAEKKWIVDQNSYCENGYGYNMTHGGEGTFGHRLSNTSKEKLRSFRLGKKHTNKTKQKMSINRKGKKPSEEHCKHLSEAQMGKKNHRYGKTFNN
jgi:group I intron endonuclease